MYLALYRKNISRSEDVPSTRLIRCAANSLSLLLGNSTPTLVNRLLLGVYDAAGGDGDGFWWWQIYYACRKIKFL